MESQLPFITIAMPVRNEEQFIGDTLSDLLNQEYPVDRYEIIVADGHSTDNTRKVVEDFAHLHSQILLLPNHGLLPSSGRNVGFKNGKGDYFLIIDGHCKIKDSKLLVNLVDCFETSGAHCLGRPQPFIVHGAPTMQRAIALARSSRLGHSNDSFIHSNKEGFVSPVSVGCAYKREVFEKIGFVDEAFDACEDVEFNYRVEKAGFSTFFSPRIAVDYSPRKDLKGLFKQLSRYGEGRMKFMYKHPEMVSLSTFLPLIFLIGVFLGPVFGFFNKYILYFYLFLLIFYFTIICIESCRLTDKSGAAFFFRLMLAFLVIHVSLGFGLLKGFYKIVRKSRNLQSEG